MAFQASKTLAQLYHAFRTVYRVTPYGCVLTLDSWIEHLQTLADLQESSEPTFDDHEN